MRGPRALGARAVPCLLRAKHLSDDEVPLDPDEGPRVCQLSATESRDPRLLLATAECLGEKDQASVSEQDRPLGGPC